MEHRAANIDDERTRQAEARDRQLDPQGVTPARQADEDEPLTWPSSDRQKMETTANQIEQGEPEQARDEPDVTPPETGLELHAPPSADGQLELPAPGYPYSQEALRTWFRSTYSRVPSERVLGALMNAMAQRELDAAPRWP